MKPREYEEYIRGLFNKQGYTTQLTSQSGDYGVDIFCHKRRRKDSNSSKNVRKLQPKSK